MSIITLAIYIVLFFSFIIGIVALLPSGDDYPMPDAMGEAITTMYQYTEAFNYLFPLDTLFTVLSWALLFHGALFVWRMIRWTIRLVKGSTA